MQPAEGEAGSSNGGPPTEVAGPLAHFQAFGEKGGRHGTQIELRLGLSVDHGGDTPRSNPSVVVDCGQLDHSYACPDPTP